MKKLFIPGLLALCFIYFPVTAQKLPTVQKQGYKAPVNAKTDGYLKEWDTFQAYNKSTDAFYTMANNDDKICLVIKVVNPLIIRKILSGGITLTINTYGKKNDKERVAVTFPVYEGNPPQLSVLNDRYLLEKNADSVILQANTTLRNNLKEISVSGIDQIAASVISIYNETGVKAAAQLDNKAAFIYELELPIKYLNKILGDTQKFSYNVKLNEFPIPVFKPGGAPPPPPPPPMEMKNVGIYETTDFWGEYTLVK